MPVSPAIISLESASAPIAADFPVAAANRHAAATFGPIEPAGNGIAMRAAGDARRMAFCVGLPQSTYTASASVSITNRSASRSRASSSEARSLSMTHSTPVSWRFLPGSRLTTPVGEHGEHLHRLLVRVLALRTRQREAQLRPEVVLHREVRGNRLQTRHVGEPHSWRWCATTLPADVVAVEHDAPRARVHDAGDSRRQRRLARAGRRRGSP